MGKTEEMEEMIENIEYLRRFANKHKISLILDDVKFRINELWIGFKLAYNYVDFIQYNPCDRKLTDAIPTEAITYENYFTLKVEDCDYRKAIELLTKWVKNLEKLGKLEFPLKPIDVTSGGIYGIFFDGIVYK